MFDRHVNQPSAGDDAPHLRHRTVELGQVVQNPDHDGRVEGGVDEREGVEVGAH